MLMAELIQRHRIATDRAGAQRPMIDELATRVGFLVRSATTSTPPRLGSARPRRETSVGEPVPPPARWHHGRLPSPDFTTGTNTSRKESEARQRPVRSSEQPA